MADKYTAREGLKFIVKNSSGSQQLIDSQNSVRLNNSPLLRRMVKDGDVIKVEGGE